MSNKPFLVERLPSGPKDGGSKSFLPPRPLIQDYVDLSHEEKNQPLNSTTNRLLVVRGNQSLGQALDRLRNDAGPTQGPPVILLSPTVRHTFRFYQGTATASGRNITVGDFLGICGGVCTVTNSSLRCIATSFKVHSVTMYPATGGSCECNWVDAALDRVPDQAYNRVASVGMTVPVGVRFSPPKDSLASKWFANTLTLTDNVCNIVTTSNSTYFDVDISYTTPNVLSAVARTITTGTVGVYYYLDLDHGAGSGISPIGLPTTI